MRIDVHAHYWPKPFVELLRGLGRTDIDPRAGQPADFAPRIAALDAAGIDVQILSAVGLDTQVADRAGSIESSRAINDIYHAVTQQHGGRFRAFGWVPLPHVGDAIAEARRCLDTLGFSGIAVPCAYQGRPLDDPEFEPFWAELNARHTVVFIHPVGAHSCCHPGLDQYNLDIGLGSPMQLAMAVSRLVYSGVRARYSDIRFVVASCGGVLPFFWPRMEWVHQTGLTHPIFYTWVKDTPITTADPMGEFRRFWYDTSCEDIPVALKLARDYIGTDRLVLGSDATFGDPVEAVAHIRDSDLLTEDQKRAILDENAAALFMP